MNLKEPYIEINLAGQRLWLKQIDQILFECQVSTAMNGPGEREGSECTPRGWHIIRAKIGEGAKPNSVFLSREPSGEIYGPELRQRSPDRDWILSRILWLAGQESGHNRGGDVDSLRRYIYIHGTPDEEPMGVPGSGGCIRLRNADVIELFDRVYIGTPVLIVE